MARLLVTFVALFAFLAQSCITQSHFHLLLRSGAPLAAWDAAPSAAKVKLGGAQDRDHGNIPAKDDPANCPICQQIMVAGAFVTPSVTAMATPVVAEAAAYPTRTAFFFAPDPSHSWQGRAPPRV